MPTPVHWRKRGPASRCPAPHSIRLDSPGIIRKLTPEWFATHVDTRYQRCTQQ